MNRSTRRGLTWCVGKRRRIAGTSRSARRAWFRSCFTRNASYEERNSSRLLFRSRLLSVRNFAKYGAQRCRGASSNSTWHADTEHFAPDSPAFRCEKSRRRGASPLKKLERGSKVLYAGYRSHCVEFAVRQLPAHRMLARKPRVRRSCRLPPQRPRDRASRWRGLSPWWNPVILAQRRRLARSSQQSVSAPWSRRFEDTHRPASLERL